MIPKRLHGIHQTRLPQDCFLEGTVCLINMHPVMWCHDDVIKWRYSPRYWPFVRGIHRSPRWLFDYKLLSRLRPHKGQWHTPLLFSLICVWINGWVNNREAGDLRRYRVHYDVPVMLCVIMVISPFLTLMYMALPYDLSLFHYLHRGTHITCILKGYNRALLNQTGHR